MEKNIANRTCIVCRKKANKSQLNRVIVVDGELKLDNKKQYNSRGAYICNNIECINSLKKSKAFNRVFKRNIIDSEYDRLIEEIKNGKK